MSELAEVEVVPRASKVEKPTTLVLEGEIEKTDLPQIFEMLFRVAHRGATRIVIDFDGVTHFDFRGVKPLVQRAEVFRKAGGDIKVSGLSPYLHAIFRSAGGAGAFDFYAQKAEAVSAFARGAFARRPELSGDATASQRVTDPELAEGRPEGG